MVQRLRPNDMFISVNSAEEALLLTERVEPDLILMDIGLPGMSGIEAITLFRQRPETTNIPVIAVSAHAMQENIQEAIEAGVAEYVTKPVDMQLLGCAIETHIQSTNYF